MRRFAITVVAVVLCAAGAYASSVYGGGDHAGTMVTANQGWTAQIASEMWHKPQGAVLMPAAFFAALRDKNGEKMDSAAKLDQYGFVPDQKSPENPNGWPVGFAIDDGSRNAGIPQFGFTCTACHTTQLAYRGKHVLIEGAGGKIIVSPFVAAINGELIATYRDPARRAAFAKEAVSYGYPAARIDHDMTAFVTTLEKNVAVGSSVNGIATPGGPGRVDALSGIVYNVMVKALDVPSNARLAVAPVVYPPIWDIWHLDWVQYNAAVHQPMARNIGEAIGLGAQLNIVDASGKLNPPATRWKSSVRIRNLYWMEKQIEHLKAPVWPAGVFGAIDSAKAARGRELFVANCMRCHGISQVHGGDTWAVRTLPLETIGTDSNQAVAFAKATYDATKLGMSAREPGALGLKVIVANLKTQGYEDEGIPKSEWPTYDGFGRKLVAVAPCGYKARPLIGIWATPPYLHNGSVPTVYDMLSDTRPSHPILGNPEYDPVKLGMVQQVTPHSLTLDTSLTGNGNVGHWWTNDRNRKGRIGPALSEVQKYELIEYLKSATYANYPTRSVDAGFPLPCGDNLHWAANAALNLMP
jgi:cytochrome c1